MNFLEILLISIGLAMDSFALSVSSGIILKKISFKDTFRIALYMGFFQGFMPIIGWLFGFGLKSYIESFDHWIAFILLVFLGSKMIYEEFKSEEEKTFNPTSSYVLLGLAIATSIDALVVGVNFALLGMEIFYPILIIGLVSFLLSYSGVILGCKFGHKYNFKALLIGGVILIGLGFKILIEHLIMHSNAT